MSKPSVAVAVVALALCLQASGCVSQQKIRSEEAPDLDRKLATFAWIEEGKLITFIVSTRPARYREDTPYVPFEIAVANTGLRRISLTRESFELRDAEGNRYPCAGPRELLAGYEFLDLDRSEPLAELEGLVFDRFAALTRYPSNFSPTRTGMTGVVRDSVQVPKFGYMVDYIYFPRPAGGVKNQRFDLFMRAPELEEPVFVKFEVR